MIENGIKMIFEPTVRLIGRQTIDEEALAAFLAAHDADGWTTDATSGAEALCEISGRCCYDSFKAPRPGGNAAYLQHILESKHGSIAEHAIFSFILEGVSRSLTHELIRHRAGVSVSELSQRYVDSSDVAFVVPPALEVAVREAQVWDSTRFNAEAGAGRRWLNSMRLSLVDYRSLADHLFKQYDHISDKTGRRKAAREAARSVLPNAAATTIFVTANARALRHVFEQRGSLFADAEFRRLAIAWLKAAKAASPNLFADIEVEPDIIGNHITVKYSKV